MNIAIIGFSHAGAVAAIELYRRGHTVTIYEEGKSPAEMKGDEIRDTDYIEYIGTKGKDILEEIKADPYFKKSQCVQECRGIKDGTDSVLSQF